MSIRASISQQTIHEAVAALGGIARNKDLLARGYSTRQVSEAVAEGVIHRIARGYYALAETSETEVFLAAHQARRTWLSKAADLGLWVLDEPRQLHVAAAHGRPVPGCVVHRVKGGQKLMDILRQCVRCGTELEALAVLESAVVTNKCSINYLRTSFSGRQDQAGRAIVELIDPQAMSLPETCGRYHLRKTGYNVQGQAYVRNAGHIDLLVDGVLGVEIDGQEFHNNSKAWREDLRRDTMYVVQGMWRLRVPAAIAMYQPDILLRWVEQALASIRSTQRPQMR